MIKASIDIGSNSTLLLIVEVNSEGFIEKVLESHSIVTALGKNIDKSGRFDPESRENNIKTLEKYLDISRNYALAPESIIATATEASRVASDSVSYYRDINKRLGLKVAIITPEAEAYYTTKGILMDSSLSEEMTIMDIGGASTEIIRASRNDETLSSFSFPIGSVRLLNMDDEERTNALDSLHLDDIDLYRDDLVVCVAGTMTSVANMFLKESSFQEQKIHGLEMNVNDLSNLSGEIDQLNIEEILEKFPFLGKRAPTIKCGVSLAIAILSYLNAKKIYISTYGLRYGSVMESQIPSQFIFKE